jgi:hypothetical protein
MKVFISYAREDLEIAKKLRNDLEKAGINTWLDKEDLLPGQYWKTVIIREIKESSHFIALLSSKALSKEGFVQKELKTALEILDYLPSGRAFVIPARIDDCEPADEKLQDIHWADLFPSYEDGLNKILRVLAPTTKVEPKKEEPVNQLQTSKPKYQLRKEPIRVSDDALKVFKLKISKHGYRIPVEYIQNDFKDNGDGTITDHATGLMWQKSGSYDFLNYEDAKFYIEKLNDDRFSDYKDWRLPTVDEMISLLEPDRQSNGMYINPLFEKKQFACWTSDQYDTLGGIWIIHLLDGVVIFDTIGRMVYHVRAVRSIQ